MKKKKNGERNEEEKKLRGMKKKEIKRNEEKKNGEERRKKKMERNEEKKENKKKDKEGGERGRNRRWFLVSWILRILRSHSIFEELEMPFRTRYRGPPGFDRAKGVPGAGFLL